MCHTFNSRPGHPESPLPSPVAENGLLHGQLTPFQLKKRFFRYFLHHLACCHMKLVSLHNHQIAVWYLLQHLIVSEVKTIHE